MNIRQPLFIIGSPRSGTSLLRLILTSHSDISVPPECGFVVWLHDKFSAWSTSDAADANSRNRYLDDLFSCKKFDTWEIERTALDTLLAEHQPSDYASLSAIVYMAYALKHSRTVSMWGDKNNFHINHLTTLNSIYPEARFLHIVRDGRDVACSYREVMQRKSSSPYSPRLNTDINEIATEWSTNVLKVSDYLFALDASRRLLLRYEDLVQNTESSVAGVCQWLGLQFEETMLEFHEANRRMKLEPALTLDWKQRTLEPISDDTVGRYRALLQTDEQILFAKVAGAALSRFGYMA